MGDPPAVGGGIGAPAEGFAAVAGSVVFVDPDGVGVVDFGADGIGAEDVGAGDAGPDVVFGAFSQPARAVVAASSVATFRPRFRLRFAMIAPGARLFRRRFARHS